MAEARGASAGSTNDLLRWRPRLSSETLRFLGLASVIFFVSAARMPRVLRYPSFWAEDGTFFFRDSIERGASALVTPILGMYLTLPRLIAFVVSHLPVAWAPAAYAAAAGIVSSLSLAVFSRDGFRWLVRSDWVRAGLCVVFCLVPGMTESFFALITLTYLLFVAVLLLLLERDSAGTWSMGGWRALLVSALWLSVGQGLVLAPLLACLAIHTRNRRYLICLASLAASVWLNLPAGAGSAAPATIPSVPTLLEVFADNLLVRIVYLPLLGFSRLGPILALSTAAFLALSAAALALLVLALARFTKIDSAGLWVLGVAIASAMTVFPVTAVTRSYGLGVLLRPSLIIGGRYDVLPSIVALVVASAILVRRSPPRSYQVGCAMLLALIVNNVLVVPLFWPAQPFLPFAWEWPREAERIEGALAKRRVGALRRSVVVKEIPCRPGLPGFGPIHDLTIAP